MFCLQKYPQLQYVLAVRCLLAFVFWLRRVN